MFQLYTLCIGRRIFFQPGLLKIRTSLHFLCNTVLRILLHVSPQFQRETLLLLFKEKCGAKIQVKYVNPITFYYVDIGTYCCVFVALLQKRIVAVHYSNIRGLSLKVAVPCRTPYSVQLPNKLTVYENSLIRGWICMMLTFKSIIFSNRPAF